MDLFEELGLIIKSQQILDQIKDFHNDVFLEAYKYATRNRKDFCCGEKMKFVEEFGTIEHDKSAGDIFHADGYLARCELCEKIRKIYYNIDQI